MACVYVTIYNKIGIWDLNSKHECHKRLLDYFLSIQWMVFVVPAIGIVLALRFTKIKISDNVILIPECLWYFACAWVFMAILIWHVQSILIVN